MTVLSMTSVQKRFGARVALERLDLMLPAGQVVALLGPNGAGKTTTINLILGFLKADGGRVEVCGVDAALEPLRARQYIAYIPEQVALYPAMSGTDNLRYFTTLAGLTLDAGQLRALLTEAGLPEEAQG